MKAGGRDERGVVELGYVIYLLPSLQHHGVNEEEGAYLRERIYFLSNSDLGTTQDERRLCKLS